MSRGSKKFNVIIKRRTSAYWPIFPTINFGTGTPLIIVLKNSRKRRLTPPFTGLVGFVFHTNKYRLSASVMVITALLFKDVYAGQYRSDEGN